MLITAPGQALSATPLTWPGLAGQPLISAPPSDPDRRAIEAAPAGNGVAMPVVCGTPAYVTVCALVSAGLGVGLVPRMVAEAAGGAAAGAAGAAPDDRAGLAGRGARPGGRGAAGAAAGRVPARPGPAAPAFRRAGAHPTGTAHGSMIHTVLPPSSVGVTWSLPPDSAVR